MYGKLGWYDPVFKGLTIVFVFNGISASLTLSIGLFTVTCTQAARKSIVLLRNNGTLPLSQSKPCRILLVGKLALYSECLSRFISIDNASATTQQHKPDRSDLTGSSF